MLSASTGILHNKTYLSNDIPILGCEQHNMTELTFDEIEKIGRWEPYRSDWPVNRNLSCDEDGQEERYGRLIDSFRSSEKFESIQCQNGGMSNFIEFICFPKDSYGLNLEAIDVFINLCAPIATYGQVEFFRQKNSYGLTHPQAKDLGQIRSENLKDIEREIKRILSEDDVEILHTHFLNKDLLPGLVIQENLLEGQKLFNYLFQWTD